MWSEQFFFWSFGESHKPVKKLLIFNIVEGPISGPSVVVHVGEDDEPPQVNGGESSSVSKSNLTNFINLNFDGWWWYNSLF